MKKIYLLLALIISGLGLNAQTKGTIFSTDVNGNMMDFRIIKEATSVNGIQTQEGWVEVYGFEAPSTATSVSISIPESVTYGSYNYIYAVTAIGESAFDSNDKIASVVIPCTITNIKSYAFHGCSNLSNVVFLEPRLEQIGESAFSSCTSLANIIIPSTVTSIGSNAFEEDYNLSQITFADNSQLTAIESSAFIACKNLTSIELPESVTSIGANAFQECINLTSINIPSGVTVISNLLFAYCYSLTSIELPEGLTSIGYGAFYYCENLTNIEIPSNVTGIESETFLGCLGLTSIKIPTSVTFIGYAAFQGCENLNDLIIEDNPIAPSSKLESIQPNAFSGCTSLTKIVLPESLTELSSHAFKDCTNLNTIIIDADSVPENLSGIINSPFLNCPSDMTIYVPVNSVELYKETEYWKDYTILPVITTPDNIEVTGTSTSSVAITWDPVPNGEIYFAIHGEYIPGVNVDLDSIVYIGIDSDTISQYHAEVKNLSLYTEYCFSVIVMRANSVVYEKVCGKTMDLAVAAPTNVAAEPSSQSSIILVWDAVENAHSYNVYRNNEFVKNVTQVICTDTGLAENTEYCYTVTAVRNETESDKSEETCANTLGDGIEEISATFDLYPNPVSDKLYVKTENDVEEVTIYNLTGAAVYNKECRTNNVELDVSCLNSGIYFIRSERLTAKSSRGLSRDK